LNGGVQMLGRRSSSPRIRIGLVYQKVVVVVVFLISSRRPPPPSPPRPINIIPLRFCRGKPVAVPLARPTRQKRNRTRNARKRGPRVLLRPPPAYAR